jgi:hypothetical protein
MRFRKKREKPEDFEIMAFHFLRAADGLDLISRECEGSYRTVGEAKRRLESRTK